MFPVALDDVVTDEVLRDVDAGEQDPRLADDVVDRRHGQFGCSGPDGGDGSVPCRSKMSLVGYHFGEDVWPERILGLAPHPNEPSLVPTQETSEAEHDVGSAGQQSGVDRDPATFGSDHEPPLGTSHLLRGHLTQYRPRRTTRPGAPPVGLA